MELIRGVADEPETRLDLRNRRVMISTTVIAGPKLWRHGGDEAVAGPDYWLEPRRSAVAIRIALRHGTRFILAVLPSARCSRFACCAASRIVASIDACWRAPDRTNADRRAYCVQRSSTIGIRSDPESEPTHGDDS